MLMMGTFLVAESVEACGLHRRIALKILSLLGSVTINGELFIILMTYTIQSINLKFAGLSGPSIRFSKAWGPQAT